MDAVLDFMSPVFVLLMTLLVVCIVAGWLRFHVFRRQALGRGPDTLGEVIARTERTVHATDEFA